MCMFICYACFNANVKSAHVCLQMSTSHVCPNNNDYYSYVIIIKKVRLQ